MKTATLNSDEILKTMVAEAVKQQTQIRSAVCDITLKALQARELGLSQINSVVRNVTKGVNAGLGDKGDVEKVLIDAVAGMDDALLKVVEANQVALTKLTEGGASFEESGVKNALDELEKLEDRFREGSRRERRRPVPASRNNGRPFSTKFRTAEPTPARA